MVSPHARRQAVGTLISERSFGVTRLRAGRNIELAVGRRKRKRIGPFERKPLAKPTEINASWSMDFVAAGPLDDCKLRGLAIVDDCSRERPVIEVETPITDRRVVAVLDTWAYQNAVALNFIRPGKPVENAYIESFNGRFRDECLSEHCFLTLAQAREIIERRRIEYNTERPHTDLPPFGASPALRA